MEFYINYPISANPTVLKRGSNIVKLELIAWNKTKVPVINFELRVPTIDNDLVRLNYNNNQVTNYVISKKVNSENTQITINIEFVILKKVTKATYFPFWISGSNKSSNRYERIKSFDVI